MKKKYIKHPCPICQGKGQVQTIEHNDIVLYGQVVDCPVCNATGFYPLPDDLTDWQVQCVWHNLYTAYGEEYCAI